MRADEFVASRVVKAVVHGIDLTQALGQENIATEEGIAATAAILDDLLARRTVPGRPPELSDDLEWILATSGRAGSNDTPPIVVAARHSSNLRPATPSGMLGVCPVTPGPRARDRPVIPRSWPRAWQLQLHW
jgi:hypothetical protein